MTLKIISAEDVVFEGEVQSVTLPGTKGSLQYFITMRRLCRPSTPA